MNQNVVLIVFQVFALILAFSVHECAHAWMAWRLGDPTARMLGRVTLNPLKHLDLFGSVLMPLIALVYHWPLIGWAKPTPVTARNFKNYKRDDIMVTLAGPASNLLLATGALILLLIIKHLVPGGTLAVFTAMALAMHLPGVSTENLPALFPVALLLYFIILINLLLFVFNLVPFPPLDGSRILRHFLPYNALRIYDRMGMLALWIFMLVAGGFIFRVFLYPLQSAFDSILAAL
ncbi:site-2 protease family protein [Edaphobacter sp. HDX4]|uniref:site-2 protease family protein n=1 Tax=Edaphobacter sp. HDX4 TaxID=2794064 RepID=UPI002FE65B2B